MIKQLIEIARIAGEEILKIYNDPDLQSQVDYKSDDSPLTKADLASNAVIMEGLLALDEQYPILSEEEKHQEYDERKSWETFWLVDPLDGTKEFINRNGEFTVNIALISNRKPVLAVIYVPVLDTLYVADEHNAYKQIGDKKEIIGVKNVKSERVAVRSKSHASPEEEVVLERYDVTDSISVGSSLKFCMVAEGKADIYYRHGPTMEWDTAAGQAVLEKAGGKVYVGANEIEEFKYNKENLLNGSFLCLGF